MDVKLLEVPENVWNLIKFQVNEKFPDSPKSCLFYDATAHWKYDTRHDTRGLFTVSYNKHQKCERMWVERAAVFPLLNCCASMSFISMSTFLLTSLNI